MKSKFENLNPTEITILIKKVTSELKSSLKPVSGSKVCMRCEGILFQAEECMNC